MQFFEVMSEKETCYYMLLTGFYMFFTQENLFLSCFAKSVRRLEFLTQKLSVF